MRRLGCWGPLLSSVLGGLLLGFANGCTRQPAALEQVHMQVMWVPNAQFAGYYVAKELGFYREVGLELVIHPYDETIAVRDAVARGQAEFGVDGADQVLVGRGEGQALKAIAAIYRINPTAFAALADSGIRTPEDLIGKQVGVLPDNTRTLFDAMIQRVGLSDAPIERVPYGYDPTMLYRGDVDVIPVYVFDEPYMLAQEGYDFNLILPQDYGIDAYGDTLFTTETLIEERPELVRNFVQATIRGWRYVIENPEETLDIVLQYDHPDYSDRAYERYILTNQAPLVHTGREVIGWMRESTWQAMAEMLQEQVQLPDEIDATDAYTNTFLPEAN